MRKLLAILPVLALVAALVLGRAPADAAVDSWSGKGEVVVPFAQAVTAGTVALVVTASTGYAVNVRSIVVSNSAAGFVRLYSDTSSGPTGSNLIAAFGMPANTSVVLTEDNLGPGIFTGVGKGLYVDATTGTVNMTLRIRKETKSPRGSN